MDVGDGKWSVMYESQKIKVQMMIITVMTIIQDGTGQLASQKVTYVDNLEGFVVKSSTFEM